MKIILYLTSIVTTNGHVEDLETQRKGLVVIMWFDPEFNIGGGMSGSAFKRLKHQAPVRASAFHICTPKTLKFRFGRFLVTKSAVLPRIRLHLGECPVLSIERRSVMILFVVRFLAGDALQLRSTAGDLHWTL